MDYIEYIKANRKGRGLSQLEVADAMGLTQPAVASIEQGNRKVSLEEAVKLADLFDVSLDEMTGRKKMTDAIRIAQALSEGTRITIDATHKVEDQVGKTV